MYHCREILVEVYTELDPKEKEEKCTVDNYITWKKDISKLLKRWDQAYVKHAKSTYIEMNKIHTAAMLPLENLMIANTQHWRLELLLADKNTAGDIPVFRALALEKQFSDHFSKVCDIFKNFGELKIPYNIYKMLETLKIEDLKWESIPPLAFYLNPLAESLKNVRDLLRAMKKRGSLFNKYIIEDNTEL